MEVEVTCGDIRSMFLHSIDKLIDDTVLMFLAFVHRIRSHLVERGRGRGG